MPPSHGLRRFATTPSPTRTRRVEEHRGPAPAEAPRRVSPGVELVAVGASDALVAAIASATGWTARFGDAAAAPRPVYLMLAALLPPAWVLAVALGGGYDRRVLAWGPEEYERVLNGGLWLAAGIAVAALVLRLEVSRSFLAITIPYAILLTLLGRHLLRRRLRRRLLAGRALHRVAVVGARPRSERISAHLARCTSAGYRIVGHIDPVAGPEGGGPGLRHQSRAALRRLVAEARAMGADAIAVAGDGAVGDAGVRRLSWELEGSGIALIVVPNVADVAGPRITVRSVAGLPLLHVEEPAFSGGQRVVKECIDRAGATLLLILAAPLMALIAAVLLATQGRPVLFRQERMGRGGRRFSMTKFRTMRNGAEEERARLAHLNEHAGELFKIRHDPRVTRCGALLRRCSLDELPQLWNVLSGSMSLVGPRPPLPREVELYGNDALRRLLVKPGITGLWQVSGRSDLPWEEAVRLDLHYVENWSVGLDLSLLWRTLFAVMRRQGAY